MAVVAVCATSFVEEAVDEDQPETMRRTTGLDDAFRGALQEFGGKIDLRQIYTTVNMCRPPYPLVSDNPAITTDHTTKLLFDRDSRKPDVQVSLTHQCIEDSKVHAFHATPKFESAIAPLSTSIPNLFDPPPSYNDSVSDVPPDYTTSTDLASRKLDYTDLPPPPYILSPTFSRNETLIRNPITKPAIDFSTPVHVRQHVGKKAKQAQKQAQKDKWADEGDEGIGGDAGDQSGHGAGGGDGGAGAGGGGNGGDGAGGGDDGWDDVGAGKGKKGKKNKKKNGFSWDEEEDEEKKKEDEAKKAADEAAGDVWGTEPTSGVTGRAAGGEANPNDEWGTAMQAGGKKNKKKNKKVQTDLFLLDAPSVAMRSSSRPALDSAPDLRNWR